MVVRGLIFREFARESYRNRLGSEYRSRKHVLCSQVAGRLKFPLRAHCDLSRFALAARKSNPPDDILQFESIDKGRWMNECFLESHIAEYLPRSG